MEKDYILNYVMETPGNTNRAVLSGMLDSFKNSSDGDDSSSDSDGIVIFEGEETSSGSGPYVLDLLSSDLQNTELIDDMTGGAIVAYVNDTVAGGSLGYYDGGESSPASLSATFYSDPFYATFYYYFELDKVAINAPYGDDNFTIHKIVIFKND